MQTLYAQQTRQSHLYALMGLLMMVILGTAISSLFMQAIAQSTDTDYQLVVQQLTEDNQLQYRNIVRSASIVSQVCTFLLPALFITFWFYSGRVLTELHLQLFPKLSLSLLAIFFLLTIFPIAQWLLEVNKSLPLPDWAVSLERDLGSLSRALLVMESPWELVFNLITIALIPAISEELLFRGVLQTRLSRWTRKPHIAIWLAAVIFSAVHGQFEGFLARLALGAALGYLLYWTNNLWIPIIAHFFNNGLQVVIRYFHEAPAEVDPNQELPILLVVVSVILAAVLGFLLVNFNQKKLV